VPAGYFSSFTYKSLKGAQWKTLTLATAMFYPVRQLKSSQVEPSQVKSRKALTLVTAMCYSVRRHASAAARTPTPPRARTRPYLRAHPDPASRRHPTPPARAPRSRLAHAPDPASRTHPTPPARAPQPTCARTPPHLRAHPTPPGAREWRAAARPDACDVAATARRPPGPRLFHVLLSQLLHLGPRLVGRRALRHHRRTDRDVVLHLGTPRRGSKDHPMPIVMTTPCPSS